MLFKRGFLTPKFKFGYYLYSLADGESGDVSLPTKFYGLEILISDFPWASGDGGVGVDNRDGRLEKCLQFINRKMYYLLQINHSFL